MTPTGRTAIESIVHDALARTSVIDAHTHLYPPSFGTPMAGRSKGRVDPNGLMLWGVDELLTYHYLTAEVFRAVPASQLPYETFWKMSRREQADHVWKHLFLDRVPLSEACRGVLTTIQKLGLDPSDPTPDRWRAFFETLDPNEYVDRVMDTAKVKSITMTNNVFDDNERERWLADSGVGADPRFRAVLRIDPLILNWPESCKRLAAWGYDVEPAISPRTVKGVVRFLEDWLDRMKAIYVAVSLPPEFRYPFAEGSPLGREGTALLEQALLPTCASRNLVFAMMIGSRRRVNPGLREAGDMGAQADIASLVSLCNTFGKNRFMVTMLSRENQHELAVAARKFGNLMPFGCWWFMNNPSIIDEITRMRLELLGTSFIPQHSDARVLEHLLYKWEHSRAAIVGPLTDQFALMAAAGRPASDVQIRETIDTLFTTNFENFIRG